MLCRHAFKAAAPHRGAGRRGIRPIPPPLQRQQIRSSPWQPARLTARSFDSNAAKSLQEAAALDELIDMMLSAKSQQEVSGFGGRAAPPAAHLQCWCMQGLILFALTALAQTVASRVRGGVLGSAPCACITCTTHFLAGRHPRGPKHHGNRHQVLDAPCYPQ